MPGRPEPSRSGNGRRRSPAFLLIYALANAGGVIAYLPLLTLILPIRIERLAGDTRIDVMTATVIAGAIVASAANLLFGALSDRTIARGGGRRRWIAGGLVATALSYGVVAAAVSPTGIVVAIMLFQLSVNAVLAPLLAIMAEEIPDAQKGVASGLLAFAHPVAAAFSALLLGIAMLPEFWQMASLASAVALCSAPLLLVRARSIAGDAHARPTMLRRDLAIAWISRLLVQIGNNVLFLYLLYYFESVLPDARQALLAPRLGNLLTIAYVTAIPIAVLAGRLSDRIGRRKPFLFGSAALAALGLAMMAFASDWIGGAFAFCVYIAGSAVFLALFAGFSMQLLPSARHRGRDLGVINLTNTLPALIGPLLTWLLATPGSFSTLLLTLAVLTFAGGMVILGVRGQR